MPELFEDPPLAWEERRAGPILVRARKGTPAARDLERVAARADAIRTRAREVLGLEMADAPPVVIVLEDELEDDESVLNEIDPPLDDYTRRAAHLVYRPDAPGRGLERAIVKRLMAQALGDAASRATALVDGVTGLLAGVAARDRDGPADPDSLMHLADVLDGLDRGEPRGLYFETATSFVSFLVERHGAARFRAFAEGFDPAAPDVAARAAYGSSAALLEAEWRTSLEDPGAGAAGPSAGLLGRMLYRLLLPYRARCALILAGLLLDLALTTAMPMSFKLLIDRAIVPHDGRLLLELIVALVVLALLASLAGLGRDYLYAEIGARVMGDLRRALYAKLERLSVGYYARTQAGDVIARFSGDLAGVESIVTSSVPIATLAALNVVVSVALLFVLEWRLAAISLIGLPLGLLAPRAFTARASAASYLRKRDEGKVLGFVNESIGAQAVIKGFGLHALLFERFRTLTRDLVASSLRIGLYAALVERSAQIAIVVLELSVIGCGAYLAFAGSLSIGALVAFHALFQNLASSLASFVFVAPQLLHASGSVVRVQELLDEPAQEKEEAPDAPTLPRLASAIALEGVGFGYAADQPTLRGLSLTIREGEHVAFVGPSGSGKSTVLSLVMRFYDAQQGKISFDGRDVRSGTLASLRAQMGVVFQETFLFNASIRENIRLGRAGATDAEIEAAARAAEIHDLVMSLPRGYDTPVGERGGRLSGGQRQRVAIARALVRDPAVLVLDEATSALDPGTEASINATLEKASAGRTVLSVTHRLASVTRADRIFVLDRGALREHGTHVELLRKGGLYKELWDKQSGFTLSEDGWQAYVEPAKLRAIPLLRPLGDEALTAIAGRLVTEIHPAGRSLFEAGDPGDRFFLLVRGAVDVLVPGPAGGQRRLGSLRDGDHFGEMALLRDAPRNATVRTTAPCLLLTLRREPFLKLVAGSPEIAAMIDGVISRRTARSSMDPIQSIRR
jgi:ATP-binding cassette subfamily B protein